MNQINLTVKGKSVNELVILLVIKPLFLLFIYFGFFSRYIGFFGMSGGTWAVFIALILFLFCCTHLLLTRRIQVSPLLILGLLFFIITAIAPFISALTVGASPSLSLRFTIEMLIATAMFFSVYYLIRTGVITPRFFIYSIVVIVVISTLQLFVNLIGQVSIYRIRGMGAVNYIANVFALGGTALILIGFNFFRNGQKTKGLLALFALMLVSIMIILFGSRQAIGALFLGIIAVNFLAINSKKLLFYNVTGVFFVIFLVYLLSLNIDMSFLFDRFRMSRIASMAGDRFELYARSVVDLELVEFLFGRPDYYQQFAVGMSGPQYVHPHNIFLSLVRYNGLVPFFLFVILISAIMFEYVKLRVKHHNNRNYIVTESSIFIFLMIVLIYTMLSGQQTRIFSLFAILGYAIGYIEFIKLNGHKEDYKNLIL